MSTADLKARIAALKGEAQAPVVEAQPVVDADIDLIGEAPAAPPLKQREPTLFEQYVQSGWKLCPIPAKSKGPRTAGWNKVENAVGLERTRHLEGAGLLHAFSGTCAIDIDNMDMARVWLRERGIDLDALFKAADAVQITRANGPTRGKLIYALPEPLALKKIIVDAVTVLELRCADAKGGTVQDVLPPSIHPSGAPYEWRGDWRHLPIIPKQLHDLWLSMTRVEKPESRVASSTTTSNSVPEWALKHIAGIDSDCDYDTWRDIGMRLHDRTAGSDDGFAVWLDWSAKGAKFPGEPELRAKWDTFGQGAGPQATLDGLRREITASDEDFGPPLAVDLLTAAEAEARAARVAKLRWTKLSEHKRRPAASWLVKGFLPKKPINMVFGPSGAGKSFAVLDIGLAIARGVPWQGRKVQRGAVGWLAAEAEGSMRDRTIAYEKGNGVDIDDADFYVIGEGVDLTKGDAVTALAESAPKGLVLIVVDTLAAAAGSANENSGEDMNPVLDNCKRLHEITGASVLLIHHSGKDEAKGSRGWSGIKARVDAEVEVKKRANHPTWRDITSTKQRDGTEGLIAVFEVRPIAIDMDDDGDIVKSAFVAYVDPNANLSHANASRRGQGKWHRAIRSALADAEDMRLDSEALIKAATLNVPEDKRTSDPRKQLIATCNQMVSLGELHVVDGCYEFVLPTTVAASPDAPTAEPSTDEVTI
jgi:hypothetical protein